MCEALRSLNKGLSVQSLDYLDNKHLIWLDLRSDEHFIIDKDLSVISPVLLLKDIVDSISKLGVLLVPELCPVVWTRNLDSDKLLAVTSLVVVNKHQELLCILS